MKKILLFKIGAIGDTIMTTPLLRQLKTQFPDAKIDYLIGKTASQAVMGNKNLHEVIPFDEAIFFKKKLFAWMTLVRAIKAKEYDTVFVLDKHKFCNLTANYFGIKERIGFDRLGKEGVFLTHKVYFDASKHEIHYYLDLLKAYTGNADYKDTKTEMFLTKEDEKYAELFWKKNKLEKKKVIVIAPGGAKNPGQSIALKLWPKEKYAELVSKVVKNNYAVILVGDKNDIPTSDFILSQTKSKLCLNLTGKTTMRQTAALMKKATAIICNDTGSMHIATTANDHIISLFGPTSPKRFAPLSKKSTYLCKNRGKPCNDVFGNFKECTARNDMKLIAVDDVYKSLST